MSGEHQAVTANILHIYWEIRHRLRSVHEEERIVAKFRLYFFDVIDFSGDIGNVSDGNHFHFITIFLIEIFPIDLVLVVDVEKFYRESFSFRQNLPGKDVRMMLPDSEQNRISSFQNVRNDERLSDQIDSIG